jgi:tetratricopeptide (TPR) repeat protein
MKNLILIGTLLAANWVAAQNVIYQPVYNPNDMYRMKQALDNAQKYYDQNLQYSNKLINWAIQLQSETDESIFNSAMDRYIAELRKLQKGELHTYSREIGAIETKINQEISNYNKRQDALAAKDAEANNPRLYLEKGVVFLRNKEYHEAKPQFKKAIELYPDYGAAYLYLGVCEYFTKNYPAAERNLLKSNEYEASAAASEYLGWICMDGKRHVEALSHFNTQIELMPDYEMAYYNRGSAKSDLKDYAGALADYKKAIAIDPKFSMAYNNMGWVYFEQKNYILANTYVDTALIIDPQNYVAWDSRAEIAFYQNIYKLAIDAATKSLAIYPETANSYLIRGRAKYRLGKQKEACEDWSLAGQYGKPEAYEFIQKYCNE